MARTLIVELPDELEQQVMAQAELQRVSPESLVLQALRQLLSVRQAQAQVDDTSFELEEAKLPPALRTAFQNVESDDPQERVQALLALRALYSESR